ncbi:PAS domain-containing sensor histidine kinase [Candidatus Poribacteria bacterium]
MKDMGFTRKSASVHRAFIPKMFLKSRSQGFRSAGFFRSYFILGILGLSTLFFLYFYWVRGEWEQETRDFSKLLAAFVGQISSVADRETSDAGKELLIEELKFPFIVTEINGEPIIARGIGGGLREKLLANTLTPAERQKVKKLAKKMDESYDPIPMRGVTGEEGRRILGYFSYDQTEYSLSSGSSFVITDVTDEPIFWENIDGTDHNVEAEDAPRVEIQSFIEDAKEEGRFITFQFNPSSEDALFHYGSTGLIHQLQWWMPLSLITMFVVFLIIGFLGYQRMKHNEQQAIWAGLAKETAHQLGTPISSLMGWLEILRERNSASDEDLDSMYRDMQGDIRRLEDITTRFGEIGSLPKRELLDIRDTIHRAVAYFQRRLPNRQKHVEIIEDHQDVPKVEANENLLQWVIENLIRNSLDAIDRDDGEIQIKTEFDSRKNDVLIVYKDNGKGIPRKNRSKVFLPGYSSKEHGWGLGLAIVKRIIEGYHGGSVRVVESGTEGATFMITLPATITDN